MKKIVEFLDELHANNNKEWFDANRARYNQVKEEFLAFVEKLIAEIVRFDSAIGDQDPRKCVFRINRDVRFSNDKSPYKTHFGAHIAPGGKVSGFAGYYFHLEARGSDVYGAGGHMLAAGAHMPQPKELLSIRTEIMDDPKEFFECLKKAKGFNMDHVEKLKRMPKGFPEDFEYAEYLKHKEYSVTQPLSDKQVFADGLLDFVVGQFKSVAPYNAYLNKAIEYARNEM